MKWFKHQSDARNSLKLRKVRRKYGADGYAVYWFCLEAIAYDVDKDNLTFELKEDAETIGFELSIQERRVMEIMEYMVKIGLFESSSNMITCMKLAESLDKSMTNSPKMRKWLEGKRLPLSKNVMTLPGNVSTCPELEVEVEVEEDIKDSLSEKNSDDGKKDKFNSEDIRMAEWIFNLVLGVAPKTKKPNIKKWADVIRLMRERDKLTHNEIAHVMKWANNDSFWSVNILSPSKLRDKYSELHAKMNKGIQNEGSKSTNGTSSRMSAAERVRARNERRYGQSPSSGLGMAAGNGDLRGAMDQGERGRTFEHVDQGFIEYDPSSGQDWDC